MATGYLNPKDSGRSDTTRPTRTPSTGSRKWYSNAKQTVLDDQGVNDIIASLRSCIDYFSITDVEGDDTLLRQAMQAAAAAPIDTDGTLGANSDAKVASQKATKAYADTKLAKASNLSDLANAGTARTNLGVTGTGGDTAYAFRANNLSDLASAPTARTNLGLAIGTDVQAYDADLAAIAALPATAGMLSRTGAGAFAARTLTAPAAGITITNPTGAAGDPTLVLANDLAALEALSGTNTIYYRSASDTWTAVTIGSLLNFAAGTLNITNANLAAFAGLPGASGAFPYFTSSSAMAVGTIDTDGTLAANSDTRLASQKAIKAYADTKAPKASPAFTGLVDITGTGAGQIKFPSTQNASADANTLDDYVEGTTTPTVSFATPGDVSVTYATQSCHYTKVGNRVFGECNLLFTPTWTTASGGLQVTLGTSNSSANDGQTSQVTIFATGMAWLSGATQIGTARASATATSIRFAGSSIATASFLGVTHLTSGNQISLSFSFNYRTA